MPRNQSVGTPEGSSPASQTRKSVSGAGAITEGSSSSSQPQKSVTAGTAEGSSPSSQPRKSVTGGGAAGTSPNASSPTAGAITEGLSPSQPRKSITAGAVEGSSPSSQPRKSVTGGATSGPSPNAYSATPGAITEGPSPSSQPRKSVTAGAVEGSSQPRKSVTGGGAAGTSPNASSPTPTGAGLGSSPAQASSSSLQHPQGSAPSTPSKEVAGEPVKKTPPTGWDYSQPLPNRFFRAAFTDLCFPVLAENFSKFPGFGNLPPDERLRVVNEIALDLPLKLAADLIPEEAYWKRRGQSKWRNCDINAHGRSWKQLFFERNLAEALERFDRTVDKESDLEQLMKTSAPYVHNLDIVELPSHISFLLLFSVLQRDLAGLRVNFGNPNSGWNYDRRKWGMKRSDCLSLSAALSVTATLTSLHLASNRIDPEKEAGKQMKELWISNCRCGEELEKKMLTFLVERLFGRTCFHHAGVRFEEPAAQGEVAKQGTEEEEKRKAEEEAKKEDEDKRSEGYEEDEDGKKEREEKEKAAKQKADEEAAAAAVAAAEAKALADEKAREIENMIHVGHGHDEACTLECSHMVGLPSTKPPPEPVVYPEKYHASRDAQAAIKQIQDAKPYWGLDSIKDLKEKGPE